MVQVACDGVGPVLMVHPRTLDWGTVPVLWCIEKHITITNESQIPASFSAFMVTAVNYCVCNMVKVKFCSVCYSTSSNASSQKVRCGACCKRSHSSICSSRVYLQGESAMLIFAMRICPLHCFVAFSADVLTSHHSHTSFLPPTSSSHYTC